MATATKKSKKLPITEDIIIEKFMNDVLQENQEPKNVYVFCQKHAIEESEFYSFFGSLDSLKQSIWLKFFENTTQTIIQDSKFSEYSNKNKLLTLYFTFFEVLTLNRTYILFYFKDKKEGLSNLSNLKSLRTEFKKFIEENCSRKENIISEKFTKVTQSAYAEGAWMQFLFLLKFWLDDTSKGFEKTDVLIEKSVNTVMDLMETKHLENIVDLGKFLWKEKFN
ncbi:TetR family transcriptional regulator C-terminal domain-containing protein [Flavobacterium solisilvae]|uniref:TetR/AcrR family transcriptional regulator n=1 Tax=Flavobacterium solisilvae TaxID=1852019 RepID=A0ABX1QPQ9_9FLAO|nr:TetR family transcriptional regulator C-terminal domain-containing protein [Flavobacterium solisilvae]NMH24124.1 TetR/AcrR family transcriptional regulator [Flavobacterium solisilvae]